MRKITGSLFVLLVALILAVMSCTQAEVEIGTVEVLLITNIVENGVSDSQVEIEISSIRATFSEVKVYRGGVSQEEDSEQDKWVNLYVASSSLNLLKDLSQEQFLAFANIAATSYDELVMVIERLDITLSNGSKIVITPDEPFNFTASFVVFAGKTTTIVFKFNIDKSVTITEDGKTTIKPLTGITLNVRYEELE